MLKTRRKWPNSTKIPRNLATLVVPQFSKCDYSISHTQKHGYNHYNQVSEVKILMENP